MCERVDIQSVAIDRLQAVGIGGCNLGHHRHTARVFFNRQHPARALGQQAACQTAGTGADFKHVRAGKITRQPRNFRGQVEVEQKVLPQRFFRRKIMRGNHVTQRGQVIDHVVSPRFF